MRFRYRNGLPVVTIRIVGKGAQAVAAHIDFAASQTIVPPSVADAVQLKFAGFERVATGAGLILMPEYEAVVEGLDKRHRMLVGCLELPRESPIKALLGRDVLDSFKVCLDGKMQVVEVSDP